MRRSILYNIVILAVVILLGGCGGVKEQEVMSDVQRRQRDMAEIDPMRELLEDKYGDCKETGGEIAFVSDGSLSDEDSSQALYEGIQIYALSAGVSFSHYTAQERDMQGRLQVIGHAVRNQARIVVCCGYEFAQAVEKVWADYPEVSFLLIDGEQAEELGDNVHQVLFREEEAGYLAGYMTVLEGYRRLGFIGGREDTAAANYECGYLQGIEQAAAQLGLEEEAVEVESWYAGADEPSPKVYERASQWYAQGTEVIFVCGGSLSASVLSAAEKEDGLLIGADVDKSALSERFLTSAEKGIAQAVVISLDEYYAAGKKWPDEMAGQSVRYGVSQNCGGIPVLDTEWRFKNVTMENFYEIYKKIRQGEISVSHER